jgi:hypothetical protein
MRFKERVGHMSSRFVALVSKNKLFAVFLTLTIIVAGSTTVLAPAQKSDPALPVISVPGKGSFNLSTYPSLDRQVIGLVNLFRDYYRVSDLSKISVNDLSMLPPFFTHYFLAFTTYGVAMIADSTPSFRTDYYKQIFHKLIAMMNSSTMERLEWTSHNFINESYAGVGNSFRGPSNIMWTGHFALMELFYESTFRDGRYSSEIKGYLDQWNASLTSPTTWNGSQSDGLGRWGVGLIPCEPYIVFVQCNSIPFYAMRLYDNLHQTTYQEASLAGIQWWQDNMIDSRGIPIDGYYVTEPMERHKPKTGINQTYPGPALTEGYSTPKVSAYGSAWATMFYNAMGMTNLAETMYDDWKSAFVHYSTDNTAYVAESYYYPSDFGVNEYVANVFAYFCTDEMGDSALNQKLENWFFGPFEGRWDGDKYEFDTSALGSLGSFTYPVVNFAWAWTHADSTLSDLMTPREDAFYEKPYISNQSTVEGLFIYQATYDESKEAFILTVETENGVVLTFDNFPNVQGVFTAQGQFAGWSQEGSQMLLNLTPGTYSFVIV